MKKTNLEIWKDIPNYEGMYQASNLGRVKSLDRYVPHKKIKLQFVKGIILKHSIKKTGYLQIILRKNNKPKSFLVHQLIGITFLNHTICKHKKIVDHKNKNRSDNRLENLQIITQRENANQKHLKSSSKYVGVYQNKKNKKWISSIHFNGTTKRLGTFDSEIDASKFYEEALISIKNNLPINIYKSRKTSSKYKLISFNKNKKTNPWLANVYIEKSKIKYVGYFATEKEAYLAQQEYKLKYKL